MTEDPDIGAAASKQALRQHFYQLIRAVDPTTLLHAAKRCLVHLSQLSLPPTNAVLLYRALRGEVREEPLWEWARAQGLAVYFPRLEGDGLEFRAAEGEWVRSPKGFWEPSASNPPWSGEEALLLAPALAADTSGRRLGRGGGYYDRFLAAHPELVSAVLILDAQLVERLPKDPWDRPFDAVITPAGARRGASGRLVP